MEENSMEVIQLAQITKYVDPTTYTLHGYRLLHNFQETLNTYSIDVHTGPRVDTGDEAREKSTQFPVSIHLYTIQSFCLWAFEYL